MAGTSSFSIASEFAGATVLLTGGSGFLGSLVLEALLRATDAGRIYLLLRPRGGASASERAAALLQTPLFHRVRERRDRLARVTAVEGDISRPGLGLSPADAAQLAGQLHYILHCAADIRLEADVQSALTSNYFGTEAVLQLAACCTQLRALVHTSSCFVNMNQQRGSVINEALYPLGFGGQHLDCKELVQDLMRLPPHAADTRAAALCGRLGFPNSYTLSKHLAEQRVAAAAADHSTRRLRAAIVRPSLVCATAYEPHPGYIGNWAGPIGASAALAIGFYHSLSCVSSRPLHVWDVTPGDLAASSILAAAAALAAGDAAAEAQAAAAAAVAASCCSSSSMRPPAPAPPPLLVVQSSSSSTWPLTLMEGWNHAVEFIRVHKPKWRLALRGPPDMPATFEPDPAAVRRQRRWIALKVAVACWLLRLCGLRRAAARLRNGFEALQVYGTSKTDKDLVFTATALQHLESRLLDAHLFPLVMRPGMRLPTSAAAGAAGTEAEGRLTWRRYFHTQMAAVYSLLFRVKVPRVAPGSQPGVLLEHDFVFVR